VSIEVIKPGLYTTFQDLGRSGFQHVGVPVNGVMDERAHRLANILVGNSPEQATLEITLMGPTLAFHTATTIALGGADLSPSLGGQTLPVNQPVNVHSGAKLTFGRRTFGMRAYLAIHGGYALSAVMGSVSTNVRAGFGGLSGQPIRKGDVIALRAPSIARHCSIPGDFPYDLVRAGDAPVRVIGGREWEQFSEASQHQLLEEVYTITPQSDRMGYNLSGPKLSLARPREILSEAVTFGTIQVPPSGDPIILMADRGTSGGYPRIANVISVDLPRLAQKMPGDPVHFEKVTLDKAHELALCQARLFAEMETAC
jgi:urea carboxylase